MKITQITPEEVGQFRGEKVLVRSVSSTLGDRHITHWQVKLESSVTWIARFGTKESAKSFYIH